MIMLWDVLTLPKTLIILPAQRLILPRTALLTLSAPIMKLSSAWKKLKYVPDRTTGVQIFMYALIMKESNGITPTA
jgi:hypothetical protein